MPINTILGQVATGEDFLVRTKLTSLLWDKIKSGSNILISAPRRVGKTSLLYYLKDTRRYSYEPIYLITESVNNENEFFKKLYVKVFELLSGIEQFAKRIKNLIGQKEIKEITKDGIKLESKTLNYYDALIKLLGNINPGERKLLIMIDEFAETVENIIKDENENKATHFLQKNRELRHFPEIKEKVQFIYAGSIGLENVVTNINSSSTIDDLYSFKLPVLTRREAKRLILEKILKNSEMELKNAQMNYLSEKIEWLIPFYMQLLLDEIYTIYASEELKEVTNKTINQAFKNAIKHRNYFDLWLSRLRKTFKKEDFNFVKSVLNLASAKKAIRAIEISNLAEKYNIRGHYKNIINTLIYDGYINNNDDSKVYRFNSPLLKTWWYENEAN